MTNNMLYENILDALDFSPAIDSMTIRVSVEEGQVSLTGYVRNYDEKVLAERIVERVRGVQAVKNDIEVRFPKADVPGFPAHAAVG